VGILVKKVRFTIHKIILKTLGWFGLYRKQVFTALLNLEKILSCIPFVLITIGKEQTCLLMLKNFSMSFSGSVEGLGTPKEEPTGDTLDVKAFLLGSI